MYTKVIQLLNDSYVGKNEKDFTTLPYRLPLSRLRMLILFDRPMNNRMLNVYLFDKEKMIVTYTHT